MPCLKKLAILTSTFRYNSPIIPAVAIKTPDPNIDFGLGETVFPKYDILPRMDFSELIRVTLSLFLVKISLHELY